jgi:hypothetical protein
LALPVADPGVGVGVMVGVGVEVGVSGARVCVAVTDAVGACDGLRILPR